MSKSELKTKKTNNSVRTFISSVKNIEKRNDANTLIKLFTKVTKKKPTMWGDSIVGFGEYHYKSISGREGDWLLTGFSPRKQNLTIYTMLGFEQYKNIMKNLGSYKTARSCLYIKKLSDIDTSLLKKLIKKSFLDMKKKYSQTG